jgi:hypothetical protein
MRKLRDKAVTPSLSQALLPTLSPIERLPS